MKRRYITKKIEVKAKAAIYEEYIQKYGNPVLRYQFKTNPFIKNRKGFIVHYPDERSPIWVNEYDFRYRYMPFRARFETFDEEKFFSKPLLIEVEDLTFRQYVERYPNPTNKYELNYYKNGNNQVRYITHGNEEVEWIHEHEFQKLYEEY